MTTTLNVALLFAVVAASGCATVGPPGELVAARGAYDRASRGPAGQLDPTDLHTAKESLDAAERSFTSDGDSQNTRDMAYTADSLAQIATAHALAVQSLQERDATLAKMNENQTTQVKLDSVALGRANMQIASGQQALGAAQARATDAEQRAAQAVEELARVASIRREGKTMVITLSGSVLFVTNKADVLPAAQAKLDDVANALMKQDPSSKIVVQGYTDSRGSEDLNRELSQRRADVVRAYLVSHGVPGERITAEGFGPASPIADNASPEGRANNRRVQIVVQPAQP